jgi:ribosome biogenesis protein MAK21
LFFHKFFLQKNEKERAKAAKVDKRKDHDENTISGSDRPSDDKQDVEDSSEETSDTDSIAVEEDEVDNDADEAEIWKVSTSTMQVQAPMVKICVSYQVMQATMPKESGDSDLMDDSGSDDYLSGIGNDDDAASDAALNLDYGDEADTREDDDSEHVDLAEGSDNDDLINLDDDLPEGLINYDGPDAEDSPEDEWAGFGGGQKRKREEYQKDRGRQKKLRSLPTFANYEDYAKMIDEGPDDDV